MAVKDGPACPGCGLPNYEGLCPVCRGDEDAAKREGLPYPWPEEDLPSPDDVFGILRGYERDLPY
jgi:hypothetical protein